MAEKKQITGPSKVKYNGIFDMSEVYKLTFDLLSDMEYDIEEKKYKEKVSQSGNKLEIEWFAEKKIDDYTQLRIDVFFFVTGLTKVDVEVEGTKISKNKGDIEITIKSFLITDYEDRWENAPFLKFMKGVYDKYLYKNQYKQHKDIAYNEAYKLENELKAFFQLIRFM